MAALPAEKVVDRLVDAQSFQSQDALRVAARNGVAPGIENRADRLVEEDPALGVASQIEPYTRRIDRWRIVERARRRLLSSHVCTLYYSLYRFL